MNLIDADALLTQLWFQFALVGLFGFLTGLEFRSYREDDTGKPALGSARTYTLTALLGFVLYSLDQEFRVFLAGMVALLVLYALFYSHKLRHERTSSVQILAALLVYSFGPIAQLLPIWYLALVFVALIFTLSAKPLTHAIYRHMDHREIVTLAKFLLLAGVILPLLPKQPISSYISTTPFAIWVAVVAISAISYLGYILQRYVAPHGGYLITGTLGGIYSSTATTVVLARKARGEDGAALRINAAIVAASGMMYLRLLVLIGILNPGFLHATLVPFLALGVGAIIAAIVLTRKSPPKSGDTGTDTAGNPLELGTAFVFALLFITMLVLTKLIAQHFGGLGLQLLSFGVGFTDIDPFVLSLLKGAYHGIGTDQLVAAIFIAVSSNNILKALYAVGLGGWSNCRTAVIILLILAGVTLGYGLVVF